MNNSHISTRQNFTRQFEGLIDMYILSVGSYKSLYAQMQTYAMMQDPHSQNRIEIELKNLHEHHDLIDQEIYKILSLQQPRANDLRTILRMQKGVTLHRIITQISQEIATNISKDISDTPRQRLLQIISNIALIYEEAHIGYQQRISDLDQKVMKYVSENEILIAEMLSEHQKYSASEQMIITDICANLHYIQILLTSLVKIYT